MSKTIPLIVLIMIASLVFACQQETPLDKAAITKAVLKANEKLTEASNSMDVDEFFKHIVGTDPGCIINDGILYQNRQAAYDDVSMGFEVTSKIKRNYEQTHVTVLSSDTALFIGQGQSEVLYPSGRAQKGPFTVSLLFIQKDGQWKVLHGHFSTPNTPGRNN